MFATFVLGSKKADVLSLLSDVLPHKKASEILAKTGSKFVHACSENEDSLSLGVEALKKLELYTRDFSKLSNEVSALISVTETPSMQLPGNSTGYLTHSSLTDKLFVIDLNAGCTGFVDALRIAKSFNQPSIIVTSETYSKRISGIQRNLTPLFSDAAAACFFDPASWIVLGEVSSTEKGTSADLCCEGEVGLFMNGSMVVQFVMERVIPDLAALIYEFHPTHVYLHQGSLFVMDYLRKNLKMPHGVYCPTNVTSVGNTVSSSIPILIAQTDNRHLPLPGDRVLLSGFGVGLTHSALVLEAR